MLLIVVLNCFSALSLLVGWRKGHLACKNDFSNAQRLFFGGFWGDAA